MKHKRLLTNKKGISTLFVAIYVALITIVLISTLFISTTIYQSSLDSTLRLQQKQAQEQILITGPNGVNVSATNPSIVQYLKIQNTGAITVRIKALYIAGEFICDPSTLLGDSYIQPGYTFWLNLTSVNPPVIITNEALSGIWTVVTERGTKCSETGSDILYGPPGGSQTTDQYYFGPLLLIFDQFHWSNDGGNTWNNGWTISKNNNGNSIIWRILVADIDPRPIILSSGSSFSLVQNSQQQNKIATWTLGPSNLNPPNLTLKPNQYNYIYFSIYSGPSFSDMYSPNPVSSNFLTFIGNFREQNNTLTPFGQTIPFEAVLVTG